jgi:hypothetical protein
VVSWWLPITNQCAELHFLLFVFASVPQQEVIELERFEHPVGRGLDEAQAAPFFAPVFLLAQFVISAQARGCCVVACNVMKHALLVEASWAFSRPNIGDAQVRLRREGRLLGPSLSTGE